MKSNQEMKMQLLKEFGISGEKETVDFCREAYKFLMEDDAMTVSVNTVKGNQNTDNCPVGSSITGPASIDLGLPSGTLWSDRNVGASAPEDYGAFFSWGNTDPHYPNRENGDWGTDNEAFKDVYDFDYNTYNKTEGHRLDADIDDAHDAATFNMGPSWRMPTKEEFQELYDNCTWERRTMNGVNGYRVTSKVNGNSIFFPCSGYGSGASWYNRGTNGYYWSRSFKSEDLAWFLYFNDGGVNPQDYNNRHYGFAVRPVQKLPSPEKK